MQQWGEIQARSRKLSYAEFLSLAKQKRLELDKVLCVLEEGVPSSLQEISEVVEVLQEGASWFPGGSKEMRVSVKFFRTGALYRKKLVNNYCCSILILLGQPRV